MPLRVCSCSQRTKCATGHNRFSGRPLGSVAFDKLTSGENGITVVDGADDDGLPHFGFTVLTTSRLWEFRADTAAARRDWLTAMFHVLGLSMSAALSAKLRA